MGRRHGCDASESADEIKIVTDLGPLRNDLIRMFGLEGADLDYTFYYDETNNVRRLYLTEGKLNIIAPECFVLGGIVHAGQPRSLDIAGLHEALGLQATTTETKVKHIGKGDFLALLGTDRFGTLFDWLEAEDLHLHYEAIDIFYWSIVDVIDSIISDPSAGFLATIGPQLKSSLYDLLRDDVAGTAELLGRYGYPDVGPSRREQFMSELLDLAEFRQDLIDPFSYQMLKGVLRMGARMERLAYLEDETPDVLIESFGPFFVNRIATFAEATHILDREIVVERYIAGQDFRIHGKPLSNFRFADSSSEGGIQISDLLSGILGKFFTYANRTTFEAISADLARLPAKSRRNLVKFARHMDRSSDACSAFAHCILALEDQRRVSLILAWGQGVADMDNA